MGKEWLNLVNAHRGVSAQQQLQIASIIVSIEDHHLLSRMGSSIDMVGQLKQSIETFPYTPLTKKKLRKGLEELNANVSPGVLIDMVLDYVKILKQATALELFDEVIERAEEKYGSVQATPQQTAIVKQFFDVQEQQTVYSGRIGRGIVITDLLQDKKSIPIYGQDFAVDDLMFAEIRLNIAGFTNVQVKQGSILTSSAFENQYFDFIYDTPRFGYKPTSEEMAVVKQDPRFSYYGVPSRVNADLGFMVASIPALNETGKAAFFFTTGALSRSGADAKIRQRLVTNDVIEAVIEFPAGFYAPATMISSVLVLVNKTKKTQAQEEVLFINATGLSESIRKKTILTEEGLEAVLSILSERKEVKGVSKIVSTDELYDFELVPSRYVFENEMELEMYGTVEVNLQAVEALDSVPLRNIATIFRGYNALPKDENPNGNVAMLKIADIVEGEIQEEHLSRYAIGGRTKIDNYRLQKGDIVLSIRGQLKLALFDSVRDDVLLSQNFIGIRCHKNFDPAFVKLYLESPTMQFIMHSKLTGSTVLNLPTKDIEEFKIPTLPVEHQQQIVADYQKEQAVLKTELDRIQLQLKESKLNAFQQIGIGGTFVLK